MLFGVAAGFGPSNRWPGLQQRVLFFVHANPGSKRHGAKPREPITVRILPLAYRRSTPDRSAT